LLLLLLSLLVTSCGKSRFKSVSPVTGRVLVNGEPAEGVTVYFHSLDDPGDELVRPWAVTDANGSFIVTTYKVEDGLPAGSYAVSLIWAPTGSPRGSIARNKKLAPLFKNGPPARGIAGNKLPARYSKAETSGIKVQIAAGKNVLPPFELEKK
jgi:hypothetical protein